MFSQKWTISLLISVLSISATAQKIIYSEPDREDSRRLNFEIIGKIQGNFFIYKNVRNDNWITILDNDMQQIAKVEQAYIPNDDRLINVDFFPYSDFVYLIYQYQRKNTVYCMAAKIGPDGNKIGDVTELDTTHIGFAADNKIYSTVTSEDKSRISVFKINSRDKKLYKMTTLLYDDNIQLLKKSRITVPMEERNNFLDDFNLDNQGDLVFTKFIRNRNDNISSASFIIKKAQEDTLTYRELKLEKTWLDDIQIKVDNFNKRYILTSLYYTERRGNIDGIYLYVWEKENSRVLYEDVSLFSDALKKEARGDASIKTAFNDFFIRDIITRRDGGFIISSEAYYTTSRFNNWNRWDYLYGSPLWSYNLYNDYYYYSPYFDRYGWRARSSGSSVRYHADNIAVLSFTPEGKLEWGNVIGKSQFDDESGDLISYQLMNTGSEIRFLFNQPEKRKSLLTDFTITPSGELSRSPTLKNLDKGYEFMPKYGKQVSAKQMIIPCRYRNYICFAKLEYN